MLEMISLCSSFSEILRLQPLSLGRINIIIFANLLDLRFLSKIEQTASVSYQWKRPCLQRASLVEHFEVVICIHYLGTSYIEIADVPNFPD